MMKRSLPLSPFESDQDFNSLIFFSFKIQKGCELEKFFYIRRNLFSYQTTRAPAPGFNFCHNSISFLREGEFVNIDYILK